MKLDADSVSAFLTAVAHRGSVPIIERVPSALGAFILTPHAQVEDPNSVDLRTTPRVPWR